MPSSSSIENMPKVKMLKTISENENPWDVMGDVHKIFTKLKDEAYSSEEPLELYNHIKNIFMDFEVRVIEFAKADNKVLDSAGWEGKLTHSTTQTLLALQSRPDATGDDPSDSGTGGVRSRYKFQLRPWKGEVLDLPRFVKEMGMAVSAMKLNEIESVNLLRNSVPIKEVEMIPLNYSLKEQIKALTQRHLSSGAYAREALKKIRRFGRPAENSESLCSLLDYINSSLVYCEDMKIRHPLSAEGEIDRTLVQFPANITGEMWKKVHMANQRDDVDIMKEFKIWIQENLATQRQIAAVAQDSERYMDHDSRKSDMHCTCEQ